MHGLVKLYFMEITIKIFSCKIQRITKGTNNIFTLIKDNIIIFLEEVILVKGMGEATQVLLWKKDKIQQMAFVVPIKQTIISACLIQSTRK